jgi:uncharacterized tellurite resistance protein B-like protein
MSDRFESIAKILMGAALADDNLDGRELDTVRALVCEAMGLAELPEDLERKLHLFDKDELDVAKVVEAADLSGDDDKIKLLELIVAVHDSDEVWDLHEDEYLRKVADAMGLAKEKYADMTLDFSIEEAGTVLKPPPLPPPRKK